MKTLGERLAYLAGLIDGEGTVSVQTTSGYRKDRGRRERSFTWKVDVSNTNPAITNEVVSILEQLGIGYFFGKYNMKNIKHKPVIKVVVSGRPRVEQLLNSVLPWLVGKKPQAELLLRMAARRKELSYHSRPFDDCVLVDGLLEMRQLNRRGTNLTSDQFAPSTRQESSLGAVVGGQGEHNIPTGQPEPTLSSVR